MKNIQGEEKLKRPKWPLVIAIILLSFALIFAFFPLYFPWTKATDENTKTIETTFKNGDEWGDWLFIKVDEYENKLLIKSATEEHKKLIEQIKVGDKITIGVFKEDVESLNNQEDAKDIIVNIVSLTFNSNEIYSAEDYNSNLEDEKQQMTSTVVSGALVLIFASLGFFLFYLYRKKRIKVVRG